MRAAEDEHAWFGVDPPLALHELDGPLVDTEQAQQLVDHGAPAFSNGRPTPPQMFLNSQCLQTSPVVFTE